MPGQHNIYSSIREQRPDLIHATRLPLCPYVVDGVMEIGDGTDGGIGSQILHEPVVLRSTWRGLVILAGGIQVDEMPAGCVETVVMRNVVPIIKIVGCLKPLVLVISNRGI